MKRERQLLFFIHLLFASSRHFSTDYRYISVTADASRLRRHQWNSASAASTSRPLGESNFRDPNTHYAEHAPTAVGTTLGTMGQARVAAEAVLLLHVIWCVWVLLGWTVTRGPPRPADAAHYFARLRYRHRAASLGAMPAHGGRNPTRSSSGRRTRAWTVPRARARCDCLPRPAGVARRWRCSVCLRGHPGCLFEALSASARGRYVVIRVCW